MDLSLPAVSRAGAAGAPPDLRERRRRRTRAEIERVALALFDAHGYDRVTVDDIAAAAGISRRTFFRYFATKEEVVFADHGERLEDLRRALAARPADEPPVDALRAAVLAVADDLAADRDLARRRHAIVHGHPGLGVASVGCYAIWEREMTRAVAARMGVDPTRDVRPGVIVSSTVGALRVAIHLWEGATRDRDLRDLLTEAFGLLDRGLTRPDP